MKTATAVGLTALLYIGSTGILGDGEPRIRSAAYVGEAFAVITVMAWGAHWWQVVDGPLAGAGIAYHDPQWDVR